MRSGRCGRTKPASPVFLAHVAKPMRRALHSEESSQLLNDSGVATVSNPLFPGTLIVQAPRDLIATALEAWVVVVNGNSAANVESCRQ